MFLAALTYSRLVKLKNFSPTVPEYRYYLRSPKESYIFFRAIYDFDVIVNGTAYFEATFARTARTRS